ncbi:LysR substrate-binding domain-containing protein [Pseudonocardia acaciae]|uniref:LysR substrate-binding domain-containing protein n=1 Tax=Pseudonocardia acaciae TaxID=551276 RepID=UPI00048B9AA1|nr:LysR substrate-binding domain-containing protein [Pseudonocardia acaciae]
MTALPDVESLRLLVLVSQRGSLTAAAAEAGISQPSASKRISALERRLGLRLLDRSRRGSALTEPGVLVGGWAQRVLDEVTALLDGVRALTRDSAAQLSVAASLTVAEHLLPAWLGELRRSAPTLRVGLRVMNSALVCEQVRDGAVDLGFIESPGPLAGLRSRTVARDRLVLVVPPEHRWARRRRPVGPDELAATALVSREPGSGTREAANRAVAASGRELARPLLELGSSTSVRSAVAAGAGPALISELEVASDLATRSLVEVTTEGMELGRALRAVWRSGTRPTGAAADLLAQVLRRRAAS